MSMALTSSSMVRGSSTRRSHKECQCSALTEPADHVVVSLNKGLGAPYGGLLCSDAEFIERAHA